MQGNELSGTESLELYIVWEGLLATLPETARFGWYVKTRQYRKALALYETCSHGVSAAWQQLRHGDFGISVVTYLPARVAAYLPDRLEQDRVPHRECRVTSPAGMVRSLATMPWLYAVLDPDPTRKFVYGVRGIHVPTDNPEMIGWIKNL